MKRARTSRPAGCPYVTRGGLKLEFALRSFNVQVDGLIAADLGCHKGGFTDCLLQHGVRKVFSVDTACGLLDWKLRNNPRVVVCERTNLLHWKAPEPVDLAVIDAGWTRQRACVPAVLRSLKTDGTLLSLVKPQYEADKSLLARGVLPAHQLEFVMENVRNALTEIGLVAEEVISPVPGSGGNTEVWIRLRPCSTA